MECAQRGNAQDSCTSLPFSALPVQVTNDKLSQEIFPVALQTVTVSPFLQPLCALKALTPSFFSKGRLSQISTCLYLCSRTELEAPVMGMYFYEQRWETPQGTGMRTGGEQGGMGRPGGCTEDGNREQLIGISHSRREGLTRQPSASR